MAAKQYRWFQDNHSVTVDIYVPAGTLPTHVRLMLSKRRFALRRTDRSGGFLISRSTYAPIDPRCTDCYTMTDSSAGEPAVVRVVLYKAVQAGWISLFAGDPPGQGLVPSPAPLSHTLVHVAALARSREAAAREAAALAEAALAMSRQSQLHQTWRTGCHEIKKKTPGGVKIHYGRNAPERAADAEAGSSAAASTGVLQFRSRSERLREPWSTVRRVVPEMSAVEAYAAMLQAPPTLGAQGQQAVEEEEEGAPMPSRGEAAAAKAAIEAVRKGAAPEPRPAPAEEPEPTSSDDDDADYERWEGGGAHPDDIEYPLPGSDASCDSCGQVVDKYYHCVQCGVIKGFDLCEQCKRVGIWSDKHER